MKAEPPDINEASANHCKSVHSKNPEAGANGEFDDEAKNISAVQNSSSKASLSFYEAVFYWILSR
jgi:hypothetical protein